MRTWLTWPLRLLVFGLWYARELVISSLAIVRDNLTPGQASTPGIARFDTLCRTDAELTMLAALITLTPGTLVVGTTRADRTRTLYVHGMYSADADGLRTEVRDLERRMLHAVRREGAAT